MGADKVDVDKEPRLGHVEGLWGYKAGKGLVVGVPRIGQRTAVHIPRAHNTTTTADAALRRDFLMETVSEASCKNDS